MGNCLLSITGFLNGDTTDIWPRIILVIGGREGCTLHCGMFSSILGIYPLNASSKFLQVMTTESVLRQFQRSPRVGGWRKSPQVEMTYVYHWITFHFFIHLGMLMYYYINVFLCVCCSNAYFYFLTLENCSRNSSFKRSGPE